MEIRRKADREKAELMVRTIDPRAEIYWFENGWHDVERDLKSLHKYVKTAFTSYDTKQRVLANSLKSLTSVDDWDKIERFIDDMKDQLHKKHEEARAVSELKGFEKHFLDASNINRMNGGVRLAAVNVARWDIDFFRFTDQSSVRRRRSLNRWESRGRGFDDIYFMYTRRLLGAIRISLEILSPGWNHDLHDNEMLGKNGYQWQHEYINNLYKSCLDVIAIPKSNEDVTGIRYYLLEFPEFYHVNDRGRLHNPDGPALRWRNGRERYAVDGIRVDKKSIERKLTIGEILTIKNVEKRSALIKQYGGVDAVIRECGFNIIEEKDGYRLISVDLGPGRENCPYLVMINPSTGEEHMEGVPTYIDDIDGALQFRNQTSGSPIVLT
jgi:hypothetical protein